MNNDEARLGNISILYGCQDMRLDVILHFDYHNMVLRCKCFSSGFEGSIIVNGGNFIKLLDSVICL